MDKTLSKRQYSLLVYFIPFVFKVAMLPSMLAEEAGNDAWVTIVFLLILEMLQLALVVQISLAGGVQAIREKYGGVAYTAVTAPLLFVFGFKSCVFLSEAVKYVRSFLFYNITGFVVTAIFVTIIIYVALRGAGALGRLTEILMWLMPTIFLVGLAFGDVKFKSELLLPILAKGFLPVAKSFDKYMLWMFDFSPLMFIKFENPPKKKRPYILIAAALSLISIVAIYAAFFMNYGGSAFLIGNAFATLAAFNKVTTEVGSIDWPVITIWLSMAVIMLASKFYAVGKIGEGFKIRRSVTVIAFGLVVIVVSDNVFGNYEKAVAAATSVLKYIAVSLEILVPAVALVMLKMKKKNEKAENAPKEAANEASV